MGASFITGLSCIFLLFAVSVVLVIGVKYTYFALLKLFATESAKPSAVRKRKRKPKEIKPPAPPAVRSIEINPEEIDRIYVKKVG
ncbi:MAG: hypothetical protein IJZ73_05055 [Clostridia bacterium]|nr:hypothetical protein [Clostridia bacterium]